MKRTLSTALLLAVLTYVVTGCSDSDSNGHDEVQLPDNVLVLTSREIPGDLVRDIVDADAQGDLDAPLAGEIPGDELSIVKLRGKTNHFGRHADNGEYIDYHATVPDTPVWIAEYPWTRDRDIRTDETGWWTLYVVKDRGVDLEFSFVYDKEDWITTKSNINVIGDEDNLDFAIQYIDPDFYNVLMLPYVVGLVQQNQDPNFFFENAMVVTVGKSWGSMHDDRLPHGDPLATVTLSPQAGDFVGPIYFNKDVIPDYACTRTSKDGGVVWLNMPRNTIYHASAVKAGTNYPTVRFHITDADVEAGVQLYIASPPDSLEGDDDSPPASDNACT